MQTFTNWFDIPDEFEGHCYIKEEEAQYWLKKNRAYHRDDGPAIVRNDGSEYWYQNGKQHRLDGPAIVYDDGEKRWYQNGRRHRLDGPAIVLSDGSPVYYINNEYYTEQDYWCHPLVVEYKLNKLLEL